MASRRIDPGRCLRCDETKPLSEFPAKSSLCKPCKTEKEKQRYRGKLEAFRSAGRARMAQKRAQQLETAPARCEACDVPFDGSRARRPCWDHNHATEEHRGWLCGNCNTALGMANDSANVLRALAAYLDRKGSYAPLAPSPDLGFLRDSTGRGSPAAALVPDQSRPAGPGPVERRSLPH